MSASGFQYRRTRTGRVILAAAAAAALLFGLYRVVLHQTLDRQLVAAAKRIPGCTGLRYETLSIPYFAFQCRLEQAVLLFADPEDDIRVQALHVRKFRPGETMPRRLDLAASGITVRSDHPLVAPLQGPLQMLGFTRLKGDLEFRWVRQGEEAQESWGADLALKIEGAGEASMSLWLDKVNPHGVLLALEAPFNWLVVLPAVELASAACRYDDRGLFGRGLAAAARGQEKQPQDVRAALAADLRGRARHARDPGVRAFWQALADFSRDAAGIAFETRLSEPLPLGRLLWMRTPADVVRGLALASRAG